MITNKQFIVDEKNILINFLFNKLNDNGIVITKSYLKKVIKQYKKVKINNTIFNKSKQKLNKNDIVDIEIDNKVLLLNNKNILLENYNNVNIIKNFIVPQNLIDIKIIYEDDNILIINKPNGIVTHPCIENMEYMSNTIVNFIFYYIKNIDNEFFNINQFYKPCIIHRLDKNTSGLMIIAKTYKSYIYFSDKMKNKKIIKRYKTICFNHINNKNNILNFSIGKSKNKVNQRIIITNNKDKIKHKDAITQYNVLKEYNINNCNLSLLNLQLITGRTHQIRIHLKHINNPILNDDIYYIKNIKLKQDLQIDIEKILNKYNKKGQLLHSYYLEFNYDDFNNSVQKNNNNKNFIIEINVPDYFKEILEYLDLKNNNNNNNKY